MQGRALSRALLEKITKDKERPRGQGMQGMQGRSREQRPESPALATCSEHKLGEAPATSLCAFWWLWDPLPEGMCFKTPRNHRSISVPRVTRFRVDGTPIRQVLYICQLGCDEHWRSTGVLCVPNLAGNVLRAIHGHGRAVIKKALHRPWQHIGFESPLVKKTEL